MSRDTTYDRYKKNKSPGLRKIRHFFEYIFVIVLMKFAGLWSIRTNQKIGLFFGLLAYKLARKDGGIARYQLDFCFPELSAEEKTKIIIATFVNLGKTFFETLVIEKFRKEKKKWIKLVDSNVVKEAAKEGRGTILVFAHLANWELLGIVCEMLDIFGMTVSSAIGEERLDDILLSNRQSDNIRVTHLGDKMSAISIIKCLRKNEFLILAFDQDMRVESVFVDFFGRKASTTRNIASLAQKYSTPVVSAFGARKEDGTHQYSFELLSKGPYQGGEKEIVEMTQLYTQALEKHIRKFPSQWVWNHRRWKTQPDD